jgi:acyl carrier protein
LNLSDVVRDAAQRLQLLTPEGDLISPMDSIDMINLFVELEAALGMPIPVETISPETFESIARLALALESVTRREMPEATG